MIKIALMAFTTAVALSAATYGVAFAVHNDHIAGRHETANRMRTLGVLMNVLALILFVAGT